MIREIRGVLSGSAISWKQLGSERFLPTTKAHYNKLGSEGDTPENNPYPPPTSLCCETCVEVFIKGLCVWDPTICYRMTEMSLPPRLLSPECRSLPGCVFRGDCQQWQKTPPVKSPLQTTWAWTPSIWSPGPNIQSGRLLSGPRALPMFCPDDLAGPTVLILQNTVLSYPFRRLIVPNLTWLPGSNVGPTIPSSPPRKKRSPNHWVRVMRCSAERGDSGEGCQKGPHRKKVRKSLGVHF